MKAISNLKTFLPNLILLVFVLSSSLQLMAQETKSSDLKDFKLVVENTRTGLNLQSIEGTAWKELSFNLSNNQAQAIDEYGMTTVNQASSKQDANLADFLFTITKTNEGAELKAIKGTAWETLSIIFSFDGEKVIIDQFGVKTIQ